MLWYLTHGISSLQENAYLRIGLIVLFTQYKTVLIIKKVGRKAKDWKKSVIWSPKDNHHL